MDNRFNIKDIVLIVLIITLGVMMCLSMMQKDRQWDEVQKTLALLEKQNDILEQIKRGDIQLNSANGPKVSKQAIFDDPAFYRVADLPDREDYAEGDFFIDAFAATVKSLTPLVAGDIYQDRISRYVLDTLLRRDLDTLKFEPLVAESWTISDDGLTFTFNIRKDVVFSDGVPMTAHDVQFSYDWIMNPKVAAPRQRAYYQKFEYVKALDDFTVEFKFREPYFAALGLCGELEILAKHYYSQFTEDEFNEKPGLLFGSGPYRMREEPKTWAPGSGKIELVRNDNFWGPPPALDRVIWREIKEDTAMEAEFRNREIDQMSIPPTSYRKLSRDEDLRKQANLYEYEYVSSGYFYVGWNQRKNDKPTPFTDKRVRQAMTMLIDRDSICSRVFDNLATPATGPFHPMNWQVDPSIKPWPFDPVAAGKLLDEAGYTDRDGNGIRESPQGVPLSFKLVHAAQSPTTQQMVELMQDAMKKAGVDMQLDPLDWPIMQQKQDDRNYDAMLLGWGGVVDQDVYQMFHSDQISDGGDNTIHYVSEEADRLISQARATVDREKSAELWRQVHAVLHEDQPYTFLVNRKAVIYVDKRVENILKTKMGRNYAWEFYVPSAVQLHTDR